MIRVLVVDNNEENLYLLTTLLGGNGCQVETACQGAEALVMARRDPPHLVVSDLLMPVMDGYSLLREWRADSRLRQIPFVVYTATYTEPEDEQLAVELGADAFIPKPMDPEAFMTRIQQVMAAAAAGKLAIPHSAPGADEPVFKKYSETLVRKLEQKMLQLTEANRALERDVAERQKVQHELAERETLLRTIIDTEPECVHTISPEGRLQEVNRAGLAMLEADSLAQVQGRSALELVAPDYRAAFRELGERVLRGESGALEYEIIGLKGTRRWLALQTAPLRDPAGGVVALLGIARDITARKRAEAGLLLQSAALEAAANAIVITDNTGRVEWANPAFTASSGYALEEAVGENLRELVKSGKHDAAYFQKMWDTILAGNVWRGEIINRRKDGSLYTEDMTITPLRGPDHAIAHFIAIKQDITRQKILEEQVRHAQRMEAIGTLASGIAHDLNNILAPMPMVVGLLHEKLASSRDRELLAMVETGAKRGADIIRQLLTFSRGTEGERALVQLRHLIKEMVNIMRETFPREITVASRTTADLWPVRANATQLHQVLMNLCVNARDAMPGGGQLELEARNVELREGDTVLEPRAKPGAYVVVTVSDTGHGIEPEIIHRIFDPFFTTKAAGQGTGLGLSTSLGIIRSHEGFIRTESELKKGTTFFVYLPAERAGSQPSIPPAAGQENRGQGELILVVDDEPSIRETAQRILAKRGYRVVTAVNGEDALSLYLQHRGEVRLVLTDVMMPVKGGAALIRSLRAQDPALKVVATSGLGQMIQTSELAGLGITTILPKPFTATEMLDAIQGELSRSV